MAITVTTPAFPGSGTDPRLYTIEDVEGHLQTWLELVTVQLGDFAEVDSVAIADITGLQTALDAKAGLEVDPTPLDLTAASAAAVRNLDNLQDLYAYVSANFTTTATLSFAPLQAPSDGSRVRITNQPVGSHVFQTYEVIEGASSGVKWGRAYVGSAWSDWERQVPGLLVQVNSSTPEGQRDAEFYITPYTHIKTTDCTMLNWPPTPAGANATNVTAEMDIDRVGGAIRQTILTEDGIVYSRKTFDLGTTFTDWAVPEAAGGSASPTAHLSAAFHAAHALALSGVDQADLKKAVIKTAGAYVHPSNYSAGALNEIVIPGSFGLTVPAVGTGTNPTVNADSIVFDGNVDFFINSGTPIVTGTFKKVDIFIDFVTTASLAGTQFAFLLSADAETATSIQVLPVGTAYNRITFRLPGLTLEGPHPDYIYTNNTQRIQLGMSIDYELGKAVVTEGGGWSRAVDVTPTPAGVIEISRFEIGSGVAMELKELLVIGRNE